MTQPRGRRQNCEDLLLADLVHVSRGQRPEHGLGEFTKADFNDPAKSVGAVGSNNWARTALGVRYVLNWREFGVDPHADALAVFEASKQKWGGREIDSTHYEDLTAPADLIIQAVARQRGDAHVYVSAVDHNTYRAARYLAFWSERAGGSALVGQRSAGGAWHRGTWIDLVTCLGMGWSGRPSEAKLGTWWRMDVSDVENHSGGYPSNAMLAICADEIREAFLPFRSAGEEWKAAARSWLREHARGSIVPVYVRETPIELAVWQPRSIHSATEAVLAGVERGGVWEHAPRWRGAAGPSKSDEQDPGRRSRHGGGATCALVGRTLQYRSEPAPKTGRPVYEDRDLELDEGPVTFFAAIGGEQGFENLLDRTPPAEPPAGPPSGPPVVTRPNPDPSRWARFRSWLSEAWRRLSGR